MFRILIAVLLACSVGAGGAPSPEAPHIVDVYPNPAVHSDDGEFVTVWIPNATDPAALSIADDTATVDLPSANQSRDDKSQATGEQSSPDTGTCLTYSTNRTLTASLTDRRLRPLSDRIRLANGGDEVRLRRNSTVLDSVSYERAPTASVYDARASVWHPLGATDIQAVTAGKATVTTFVLPDNPDQATEFLGDADNRILLAGYTLSSQRVVEELLAAHERGVSVEVVVDGSPVGGMSPDAVSALDDLSRAGIPVTVLAGDRTRYQFHHAKYAVVDDSALVTTENWKPAGLGGKSSRGWAVITDQKNIVEGLERVFEADSTWVDGIGWDEYDAVRPSDAEHAAGNYPTNFEPAQVTVERSRLLLAPDNAETEMVAAIDGANESIEIQQVSIGDPDFPLMRATLAAAERGVEVRILLSGAWYTEQENRRLKTILERRAERQNLPLDVRIADTEEFEKIHAKGLIVDDEQVYLGSLNWNNNSLRANREVVLLLVGEEPAAYYGAVFENDWEGDDRGELPVGLLIGCLLAALAALLVARHLSFERKTRDTDSL